MNYSLKKVCTYIYQGSKVEKERRRREWKNSKIKLKKSSNSSKSTWYLVVLLIIPDMRYGFQIIIFTFFPILVIIILTLNSIGNKLY